MKSNYFIITLCILFFESCTQVEISQWRGPERNGIYPEKNLLTSWPEGGPQLLWKFDSLGAGYSSPVVTSDKVYTTGTMDSISYIFSFDKKGNLLWKKPLGPDWMGEWPGIYSTPVLFDDLGYIVSTLGVLYCFSAVNGDIIWNKNIRKECVVDSIKREFVGNVGFVDNMVVDGDKLICTPGGVEKNCIALNRKTGQLIWESKGNSERDNFCSPILIELEGKKYFIYQTKNTLISINTANGEIAWKYERQKITIVYTPLYRNGYLFIPDYDKGSLMLKISKDGRSVTEEWRNSDIITNMGDAILLDNRIFGGGRNRMLYCIDWNTGKEIYKTNARSNGTTLISAENLLYCYDILGDFYLLQPLTDKFEKKGEFKVLGGTKFHCSHPVIKDGRLYIRHDNSLFVYNISKV